MNPKLIVEQKLTAFTNKYAVYTAGSDGGKQQLVAFAQQKKFAFKEKVEFYTDETKSTLVFTMRAEKMMDVHGRFLIEDNLGQLIGSFQKAFGKSLLNSTWNIPDSQQPQITVSEGNQTLAIVRRIADFIPYVSEIIAIFLRYHFKFVEVSSGQTVGRYEKTAAFRDHYKLSVNDSYYAKQDWRVYAAFAVALDALQAR